MFECNRKLRNKFSHQNIPNHMPFPIYKKLIEVAIVKFDYVLQIHTLFVFYISFLQSARQSAFF